jgi:hypothetical protein
MKQQASLKTFQNHLPNQLSQNQDIITPYPLQILQQQN